MQATCLPSQVKLQCDFYYISECTVYIHNYQMAVYIIYVILYVFVSIMFLCWHWAWQPIQILQNSGLLESVLYY